MKNREKSRPRLILHILMALCAVGILCSVCVLFLDSREYAKGDAAYQQLRLIRESSEPSTDQASTPLQTVGESSSEEKARGTYHGVDFTSMERIIRMWWMACR